MVDCNAKDTPISTNGKSLGANKQGACNQETWSYCSVAGMLLYLVSNSRCNTSFEVYHCACFMHAPWQSHKQALLRICWYFNGTRTQGLILKPSRNISVDCCVDVNFLGLFGAEAIDNPMSVRSCTKYITLLANCLLLWMSKLQTEILVNALESKFVTLLTSIQLLIPIKGLIEKVVTSIVLLSGILFAIATNSQVFEDNADTLPQTTTTKVNHLT